MSRHRKRSSFRKFLRGGYKLLGTLNTLGYVLNAGNEPGKLARHLLRKKTTKLGARIVR